MKFQLAIPTSTAIPCNFLVPEARAALAASYEARRKREIKSVLEQVPAHDLAIQWDVAVEIGLLEGAVGERPESDQEVVGEHFVQPDDAATLVRVARWAPSAAWATNPPSASPHCGACIET